MMGPRGGGLHTSGAAACASAAPSLAAGVALPCWLGAWGLTPLPAWALAAVAAAAGLGPPIARGVPPDVAGAANANGGLQPLLVPAEHLGGRDWLRMLSRGSRMQQDASLGRT